MVSLYDVHETFERLACFWLGATLLDRLDVQHKTPRCGQHACWEALLGHGVRGWW